MIVETKAYMDGFIAITKALSDTHRIRALCALRNGELCVCQIIELLGLAPSTVSKHMSILKQAGLVKSRKEERWVYYRLPDTVNEGPAGNMLNYALTLLKQDEQIGDDNMKMAAILAEGAATICKRHRCDSGDENEQNQSGNIR